MRMDTNKLKFYYIDRFKNKKPRLLTLNYYENEVSTFHGIYNTFITPEEAWKDLNNKSIKQLKKLPNTKKQLLIDIKESKKYLKK